MKSQVTLISRKAKDGKIFTVSVFNYGEGSEKEWRIDGNDDFFFATKAHAVKNARLVVANMVEDYEYDNNL